MNALQKSNPHMSSILLFSKRVKSEVVWFAIVAYTSGPLRVTGGLRLFPWKQAVWWSPSTGLLCISVRRLRERWVTMRRLDNIRDQECSNTELSRRTRD